MGTIIQAEADTMENAKAKLMGQVPNDYLITKEEILSDCKPQTASGIGETTEDAFKNAENIIPVDSAISTREIIKSPELIEIIFESHDIEQAKSGVSRLIETNSKISNIELSMTGKSLFFGLFKRKNKYKVSILKFASVIVKYIPIAKISAQIMSKKEALESSDTKIQLAVIKLIDVKKETKYIDRFLSILTDESANIEIRKTILEALSNFNEERVVKSLVNLLKYQEMEIDWDQVDTFNDSSVSNFKRAFSDSMHSFDNNISFEAAKSLAKFGDLRSIGFSLLMIAATNKYIKDREYDRMSAELLQGKTSFLLNKNFVSDPLIEAQLNEIYTFNENRNFESASELILSMHMSAYDILVKFTKCTQPNIKKAAIFLVCELVKWNRDIDIIKKTINILNEVDAKVSSKELSEYLESLIAYNKNKTNEKN